MQHPREYFLFKRVCYTLLFRALQLYRFVFQNRVWFSKFPSFPGVFPSLRKKPRGRGRKVPSPWIGSTSCPGRFSATSKPGEKRPGDEVGIGYSFWYYFLLILYLKKKTEARPWLTKAMFTPCRIVFLADTKNSQNFALGLFAFNQGLTPQFLLSYCHFLSNKRLSVSF